MSSVTVQHQPASQPLAGVTVKIDLHPMIFLVSPALPELQELLEYSRTEYSIGGPLGVIAKERVSQLLDNDFRDRQSIPLGLLPRVLDFLKSVGAAVHVTNHETFGSRHARDIEYCNSVPPSVQCMLQATAKHHRGQIVVNKPADVALAISHMAKAYSKAVIVIVARNRGQAWQLRQELARLLGTMIGMVASNTRCTCTRVTVCTYGYLPGLASPGVDIVVLADPPSALGQAARDNLGRLPFQPHRVYAIGPGTVGTTSQLQMEAICGPVIHSGRPQSRPVTVEMVDVVSNPATVGLVALEYKRAAYWTNGRRNSRIADVANHLVKGDLKGLWAQGVLLDVPAAILTVGTKRLGVIVVVESVEHGRQLRRLLPNWSFLCASADAHRTDNPAGVIMTLVHAADHGVDADVVISTAPDGLLAIPKFPPLRRRVHRRPMLLIDWVDAFDPKAEQATQLRMRAYRRHGWPVRLPGPLNAGQVRSTSTIQQAGSSATRPTVHAGRQWPPPPQMRIAAASHHAGMCVAGKGSGAGATVPTPRTASHPIPINSTNERGKSGGPMEHL